MITRLRPTAIKRQTVTSSVAEEIRRRIIRGEYAGGTQIRQEAVADELGVSRVPVREALLQLEAEGLVVIHTHKGAVVAELSANDALDLFDARLALEPRLLETAVDRASEEDLHRIRAASLEYEEATGEKADPEELSRLNWAFHTALCAPAQRPRMLAILQTIYTATDRYLNLQIDSSSAKSRAVKEHRALFSAYRQKQKKALLDLAKTHIADAQSDILTKLNSA